MEMTEGEIARNYRRAKDKDRQGGILADLNCTSREDITRILVRAGIPISPKKRRKRKRSGKGKEADTEDKKGSSTIPQALPEIMGISSASIPDRDEYTEELFRKLDVLDEEIARLEKEYRETAARIHGKERGGHARFKRNF